MSISAVSSETGIAKEVLRKWESRYGFPIPARDDIGNRVYGPEQMERLKLIKKLIDDGMRPGQLVPLDAASLAALYAQSTASAKPKAVTPLVACLLERDPAGLHAYLRSQLARLGLEALILDRMPDMNVEVGNAWASGTITVRDEHLYTEAIQRLVRAEVASRIAPAHRPHVLLATPPEELHTLGILMVEAALSLKGANCISLGAQCPLAEIVLAAQEYGAGIVGLSFSASFPRRRIYALLKELRARLSAEVQIWAGGTGAASTEKIPRGVTRLSSVRAAVAAFEKFNYQEPP